MSSIDYIKILKKAWNITWHNRFLWWFGFFTALAGGSFNFPINDSEWKGAGNEHLANFMSGHMALVITGAIILFMLLIVFLVLGVIGRGALIKETEKIIQNKPAGFKTGMKEGKKYFWKLLLQNILLILFTFLSFLVLAIPVIVLYVGKSYVIGTLVAVAAVIIFIPLIILIAFMRIYGQLYVVLAGLGVIPALERAYELLMKNKLASIIMGLLFIPLGIVLAVIFLAFIIALLIIFIPLGLLFNLILAKVGLIFIIALGAFCLLAGVFIARSIYETFSQVVWVLFFHEIAKPKVEETVAEAEPEKEKTLPVVSPVKTVE